MNALTDERKGTIQGGEGGRKGGDYTDDDDSMMIRYSAEAEDAEGFLSPDGSIAESVTLLDFLFVYDL